MSLRVRLCSHVLAVLHVFSITVSEVLAELLPSHQKRTANHEDQRYFGSNGYSAQSANRHSWLLDCNRSQLQYSYYAPSLVVTPYSFWSARSSQWQIDRAADLRLTRWLVHWIELFKDRLSSIILTLRYAQTIFFHDKPSQKKQYGGKMVNQQRQ